MKHSRSGILYSVVLAVILFVAVNVMAGKLLSHSRLDLTQNHLFTVTEGTKKTLQSLDEPVHLRFFYSAEMGNGYPVLQSYAERVRGLLKQYESLSKGKLKVDFINPQPYTEDEDQALALGLQGIPIDQAGNKMFFGLAVTNATDDTLAIPFFDPNRQTFLEYDITRLISRLKSNATPTLGILSWLPMRGTSQSLIDNGGPWAVYSEFQQFFKVDVLETTVAKIPDDINVLLVAHPATITAPTLFAIDQFVLRGGKLIMLLDPHVEIQAMADKTSTAKPLLDAWGITMSDQVAADPNLAITVSTQASVTSLGVAPNVTWLQLQKANFNPNEVATADLKSLRLATAAAFEKKPDSTMNVIPLLFTGDDAFTIDPLKLMFAEQDPTLLMKDMTPVDHPLDLAVRLNGPAKTAFPNHAPQQLSESLGPINVTLIGDTDFLRDGFWVERQKVFGETVFQPTADNGSFLLNLIDYYAGDPALISLRTRSSEDRDFIVVKKLRANAEAQFRQQEEDLRGKLSGIEKNLQDMQGQEGGAALLSAAQQGQLNLFRDQMLETRKQLRAVRHSLQENIERLGSKLKIVNIGLMPLIVLLLALWLPKRLGMKRA